MYTLLHSKFPIADKVFIYTDSSTSIAMINNDAAFRAKKQREIVDEIKLLMMEYCIKAGRPIRSHTALFEFIHIKAHTKKKDKASLINNWCDQQAKLYMQKALKAHLKKV